MADGILLATAARAAVTPVREPVSAGDNSVQRPASGRNFLHPSARPASGQVTLLLDTASDGNRPGAACYCRQPAWAGRQQDALDDTATPIRR